MPWHPLGERDGVGGWSEKGKACPPTPTAKQRLSPALLQTCIKKNPENNYRMERIY